jgi:integrase
MASEQTIHVEQTSAITQIEDYLHYCKFKKNRTRDTVKTKYYHIHQFVRENKIEDLCTVTNQQLDRWCVLKFDAGMKPKTINGHIDDIIGCLKFLKIKQERIVAINFEAVERYQIIEDDTNEDLSSFTPKDILHIKQHCRSLLEELAFSMTFESAMRLCEVTHLCVEDIKQNENGNKYFRIEGKGRKKRNTFVLPDTMESLDRWLLLTGIDGGYIFPSPVKEGSPYTRDQMRKVINRPIRRAGFSIGSPQVLRRSAVSTALENGMPLAKVSKWVGHADSRVTLRHYYRQDNERMQNDHRDAMGAAFAAANT